MTIEEIEDKYFIEKITVEDFTGWEIYTTFEEPGLLSMLLPECGVYKSKKDAWLGEFRFTFSVIGSSTLAVLVSKETVLVDTETFNEIIKELKDSIFVAINYLRTSPKISTTSWRDFPPLTITCGDITYSSPDIDSPLSTPLKTTTSLDQYVRYYL